MAEKNQPTVDDLKAPLLAAVGAADLALATVNEIVVSLRERAEEARTDATARAQERRAQFTKLQEELPTQVTELREKLSSDELRKAAEGYAEAATAQYNKLVERGEEALSRLRSQPAIEEAAHRVESVTDQAVELTQDALGAVATQTRAVGERAAKLVGVELPNKAEKIAASAQEAAAEAPIKMVRLTKPPAKTAPATKAPVKKAPAKKAPAKKVTQK